MLARPLIIFCIYALAPLLVWSQMPPPDAFITRYDVPTSNTSNQKSYSNLTLNDKVISLIPGSGTGITMSTAYLFLHDHLGNFDAAKELSFPRNVSIEFSHSHNNITYVGGRKLEGVTPNPGDTLDGMFIMALGTDTAIVNQAEIRFSNASVTNIGTPLVGDSGHIFIPLTVFRNDVVVTNTWQVLLSLDTSFNIDTALFLNPGDQPGILQPVSDSTFYWMDRDQAILFNDTLGLINTLRCTGGNCFERLLGSLPLAGGNWAVAGTPLSRPDTAVVILLLDSNLNTITNLGLAEGAFGSFALTQVGEVILTTNKQNNPCFFKIDTALQEVTDTVRIRDFQLQLASVAATGICGGKYLMSAIDVQENQPLFAKLDSGLQSYCADTAAVIYPFNSNLRYNNAFLPTLQPGQAYALPFNIQEQAINPTTEAFCSQRNCNMVDLPDSILVCNQGTYRIAPTVHRDPCPEEQPPRSYDWSATTQASLL